MNWCTKIKQSDNPKVIAMLSGGKDSVAAIVMLRKNGVDVTAIHFVHDWGSLIPTEEAKRICEKYQIPLIVKNYSKEFCEAVNGYTAGRPCLLCKKQMYKILLSYLSKGEYGWLCIGDNANDRTTIARIKQYISNGNSGDNLVCSGYFGAEMGIRLPDRMKVIRPLINMEAVEIEQFLIKENIEIKRINSTGDRYFEYHREGCPIQFADIGVELNESLYTDLKKYNDCIAEFARAEGILASIHMPSTFIITIPRGYEKCAAEYLANHELPVDIERNSASVPDYHILIGIVYELNTGLLATGAYEKVFNRFLERLELYGEEKAVLKNGTQVICTYVDLDDKFEINYDFQKSIAEIKYMYLKGTKGRKDRGLFDNLILEMFRTRKYKVYDI